MQIQHQQSNTGGEFFILNENAEKIAELTYIFLEPTRIDANHTYVANSLRGQGIAEKLYLHLVAFVKQHQLELIPSCSYIAKKWQFENKESEV